MSSTNRNHPAATITGGNAVPPIKASKLKRWRNRLILVTLSTLFALFVGELFLRWAIFHGGEGFKNLRDPGNYFYTWDEGYWKLHYLVDTVTKPPRRPHPYLGWLQDADPETYYHQDGPFVGRRRPVLLYGDSFSACIDSVECFEDILNADSTFTRDNYLLNYGIGGYGVCQASLLCRKTAPHYQQPLVVFGMLTTDIERTILPARIGQKPYYDVEKGELVLKGLPIDSVPAHYFEENGLATTSLLFRFFLRSKLNFVPYRIKTWYDRKEKSIAHIQAVNGLLIKALATELRAQGIDFIFLIFHFEDDMMAPNSEDNWHDQFIKQTMAENQIPYIWSKGIIREHRKAHPENTHDAYIVPGNGHPTTLYNRLISEEIKRVALERSRPADFVADTLDDRFYDVRIGTMEKWLRRDSVRMAGLAAKALAKGISLEQQLELDATYLMNVELETKRPFAGDGVFEGRWKVGQ